MKSIWKFSLDIVHIQTIEMPAGAEILCTQVQGGVLCIWALVDPRAKLECRVLNVIGTGHPVDDAPKKYIGTAQMSDGRLVWHVFERL